MTVSNWFGCHLSEGDCQQLAGVLSCDGREGGVRGPGRVLGGCWAGVLIVTSATLVWGKGAALSLPGSRPTHVLLSSPKLRKLFYNLYDVLLIITLRSNMKGSYFVKLTILISQYASP